jgi:hypothetical protein
MGARVRGLRILGIRGEGEDCLTILIVHDGKRCHAQP